MPAKLKFRRASCRPRGEPNLRSIASRKGVLPSISHERLLPLSVSPSVYLGAPPSLGDDAEMLSRKSQPDGVAESQDELAAAGYH